MYVGLIKLSKIVNSSNSHDERYFRQQDLIIHTHFSSAYTVQLNNQYFLSPVNLNMAIQMKCLT